MLGRCWWVGAVRRVRKTVHKKHKQGAHLYPAFKMIMLACFWQSFDSFHQSAAQVCFQSEKNHLKTWMIRVWFNSHPGQSSIPQILVWTPEKTWTHLRLIHMQRVSGLGESVAFSQHKVRDQTDHLFFWEKLILVPDCVWRKAILHQNTFRRGKSERIFEPSEKADHQFTQKHAGVLRKAVVKRFQQTDFRIISSCSDRAGAPGSFQQREKGMALDALPARLRGSGNCYNQSHRPRKHAWIWAAAGCG